MNLLFSLRPLASSSCWSPLAFNQPRCHEEGNHPQRCKQESAGNKTARERDWTIVQEIAYLWV